MRKNMKNIIKEQLGTGYNCEVDLSSPSGYACIQNQIGAGTFTTLQLCLDSGCEGVEERFTCYDNGTCHLDPNGQFASMNDCLDNCSKPTPACAKVGNGYECYYCPGPTKLHQDMSDRIHEKNQQTTSPSGCKMIGNNTSLLTDGTNLYDTILECETEESDCVAAQPPAMEECHCCTTGGASAAYTQNMGFYAVGHCGYCNRSACNPWNPGSGTLYSNFWNCAPISQGPLDCSIVNPPWAPKMKPNNGIKTTKRDMESIKEETKRFKRLISEQLGTGVNCEVDPASPSGHSCVANQLGPGQFTTLQLCLDSGCEGGCCDDCANFPNNFIPDAAYPNVGRFCTGCAIAAGTNVVINNPNNPAQTFYGLPMNIPVHSVGTTANANGQDYCCDCCNQGLLPWPVSSIPSSAMNGCGDVVNGTVPIKTPVKPKGDWINSKDSLADLENLEVINMKDSSDVVSSKKEIKEETKRFNQLIKEQLGSGVNCEVDASCPSGFCCTNNQFGAGQFVDMAACLASGCESTGVCPAGHPFHGWVSGYPTGGANFIYTGPSIINLTGWGAPINYPTGSSMPAVLVNWFVAGQSSYCEWCADYLAGGAGGGNTNSQGFDIRTDYWVGGGYGPQACSCCPPTNGPGAPLPRVGPIYLCSNGCVGTTEEPDNNKEKIYQSENECINNCADVNKGGDCCDWCYRVAQKMSSGQPPRGCFDFNCDDCIVDRTRHSDTINLREDIENIRLLHKKRSVIKGNE